MKPHILPVFLILGLSVAAKSRAASAGPGAAFAEAVGEVAQAASERRQAVKIGFHQAPDIGFIPASSEDRRRGNEVWARVEKGTLRGLPAGRVRFSADNLIMTAVQAGRASAWDDARRACREISPSWDLPTHDEYYRLTMADTVDVAIGLQRRSESPFDADRVSSIYPMWIRHEKEAVNAESFAGRSLTLGMSDGSGFSLKALDVGPEAVKRNGAALAEVERELAQGRHRTEAEEQAILDAVQEHNRRTGTNVWFNLHVPQPELPQEINELLKKPAKQTLTDARANAKAVLAAVENGYPVYCVAKD